ncbi:MAG: hypothetical protein C0446_14685 [Chitinophaga sp.]|nr:hypothetical protein [Chitinophaga sp.]
MGIIKDNNKVNNNARIKDASTTISSAKDYDTSEIIKDLDKRITKKLYLKIRRRKNFLANEFLF